MSMHGNGDFTECARGCGALLGLNEGIPNPDGEGTVCEDECKPKEK